MKKIILMMACAIAVSAAFAQKRDPQYVIGTRDTVSLGFMTDDSVRATFLGSGALIFGNNSDPITSDLYARKVVMDAETDLVMNNNSNVFMVAGTNIFGGAQTKYTGTSRSFADCSHLIMADAADLSVRLNSISSELFLQEDGGTVYVGKTYNASLTTNQNSLSVDGSAGATGYSASIKEVTSASSPYTLTNDDYTILVGGAGAVTLRLPTTAVEHGRMFHIKNITSNNSTVTIESADAGSHAYLYSANEGITIQLLFTAPGTWTYHIISTM